jgi:hypothetical protein
MNYATSGGYFVTEKAKKLMPAGQKPGIAGQKIYRAKDAW